VEELSRYEGAWRLLAAAGDVEEGYSREMADCVQGCSWATDTHQVYREGVTWGLQACVCLWRKAVKIMKETEVYCPSR